VRQRVTGQPLALCLELNQGPIVSALRQSDFLGLLPVNPLTLAREREAFTPRQAKDDPTDAALQLALLLQHREKLQPLQPQRPAMRALAPLVAPRRRVVGDTGRIPQRLTRTLHNYFPHVLPWLHEKDTALFCDFLPQWPPLKAAPLARRSPLERFFRDHHVRYAAIIAQRLHAIKSATPLTTDEGVSTPHALLVQALVSQLRVTLPAREEFDTAMAQRAQVPPAFPLVDALPGAGAVLAPRLLVAFGEQRDRYTSADEIHKSAGLAPVTARSGKQSWVHWRLPGPKCWRQPFVAWAAESIRHACWARAYSQQQRDKGASHQAAVRALACKWIRLLWRGWQTRTPYNEAVYRSALQQRGAPLIHNLANWS
jgi:hypothetical protein